MTWDGKYFAYAKARLPHVAGNDQIEAGWTELTRPEGARSVAWGTGQPLLSFAALRQTRPRNLLLLTGAAASQIGSQ
uniref:Uncharacterized protein n=1 Tax=Ammonifex degensii TaxID=42838 RepID=A0A7C1F3T4_9THEO